MSKHFAMLTATRHLENYLSQGRYILNSLAANERLPQDLFEKEVGRHNELVDILNNLFASLTDSPGSELFTPYIASQEQREQEESHTVTRAVEGSEQELLDALDKAHKPDTPLWQSEGYETHEAWLADKEVEFTQDDLSLSVNDAMSRYRVQQALDEYRETSVRDIATYLPEDDSPVNVMPTDATGGRDDEVSNREILASDYSYLDHTVDNVRVDSDPTQIAGVETAVERYGEHARRGTDIDLSSLLYQSGGSVANDLINDDIKQLHAAQTTLREDDM